MIPAIRASPFLSFPPTIACNVAGAILTSPRAIASRRVTGFSPTSTIRIRPRSSRCVSRASASRDFFLPAIKGAAPESKVARLAQLCASHWVQGSPLPPAAQAIISLHYFHCHFLDRDYVDQPRIYNKLLILGSTNFSNHCADGSYA